MKIERFLTEDEKNPQEIIFTELTVKLLEEEERKRERKRDRKTQMFKQKSVSIKMLNTCKKLNPACGETPILNDINSSHHDSSQKSPRKDHNSIQRKELIFFLFFIHFFSKPNNNMKANA